MLYNLLKYSLTNKRVHTHIAIAVHIRLLVKFSMPHRWAWNGIDHLDDYVVTAREVHESHLLEISALKLFSHHASLCGSSSHLLISVCISCDQGDDCMFTRLLNGCRSQFSLDLSAGPPGLMMVQGQQVCCISPTSLAEQMNTHFITNTATS